MKNVTFSDIDHQALVDFLAGFAWPAEHPMQQITIHIVRAETHIPAIVEINNGVADVVSGDAIILDYDVQETVTLKEAWKLFPWPNVGIGSKKELRRHLAQYAWFWKKSTPIEDLLGYFLALAA